MKIKAIFGMVSAFMFVGSANAQTQCHWEGQQWICPAPQTPSHCHWQGQNWVCDCWTENGQTWCHTPSGVVKTVRPATPGKKLRKAPATVRSK